MEGSMPLLTAFGAGVVSFLSPCVVPLLPTYTAFLAGSGVKDGEQPAKWRFLLNSIFFLAGFTCVFVAMGATASLFGQFFFDYQDSIRKFGAVFMIIMGVHLLGVLQLSFLHQEYRPLLSSTFQGPLGAFILGVAFTAGWTPCTGPILASILVYAGTSATMGQGALLLFVYAMGFSVPFFLIAYLMNRYLGSVRSLYRWLPIIQKGAALVLILVGLCVYFDVLNQVLGLLGDLFGF